MEWEREMSLWDAQTSGGLVVSVAQEFAQQMLVKCLDAGLCAAIVGDVVSYEGYDIVVMDSN